MTFVHDQDPFGLLGIDLHPLIPLPNTHLENHLMFFVE